MSDSHEEKIRKGQAFNLAAARAIQQGEGGNFQLICKYFVQYYRFGQYFQAASIKDVENELS